MPQDWFPIDSNLGTKPEVQRVLDRLGDNGHVADVIGPLVLLWGLVDQHAVTIEIDTAGDDDEFDGLLPEYSRRMIARVCGGGDSLWATIEKETGWVKFAESGVLIRGFVRRFGVGSKTRARSALRQQVHRANAVAVTPVTTTVTRPLPEERERDSDRKVEEKKNTGPVREARSFAAEASAAVASVDSGSARPGSVSGDWQKWDSLRELHVPLSGKALAAGASGGASAVPSEARPAASAVPLRRFEGKVTRAFVAGTLADVAAWLEWQAAQARPLLPATEAALVMLWAVIKAKRAAKVGNVPAATITLVSGKATNAKGERVDRSSEWQEAERLVAWSIAQVAEFLRPTPKPASVAGPASKSHAVSAELLALEQQFGAAIDAAPIEDLLALLVDPARSMFRKKPDRQSKFLRPSLLRAFAAAQQSES